MATKKKSEASIALIVVAVIGLIIIVVVIAIISGKLNAFVKGKENTRTCQSACNAIGKNSFATISIEDCEKEVKGAVMPGDYSDVAGNNVEGDPKVCCCYRSING